MLLNVYYKAFSMSSPQSLAMFQGIFFCIQPITYPSISRASLYTKDK